MTADRLLPLEEDLGYTFQDRSLLELALTHPSVQRECIESNRRGSPAHNQRLEFLGDAVIGMILSEALYQKFPQLDEGPLTKSRAQLVNQKSFSEQALRLRLGERLTLSKSEEGNGGRTRMSSLADAFEALMGALFLDGGITAARAVILRCFEGSLEGLAVPIQMVNPKGELQELLQGKGSAAPTYDLVNAEGPDHAKTFLCSVHHQGEELGRGNGRTKREAESAAAEAALSRLRQSEPASLPPL